MSGMKLRNWVAWMPGCETVGAWRQWAHTGAPIVAGAGLLAAPPPIKEIPPLLRRRAAAMGRAALHVLSRPELPYAGQPIVLCSRHGEFQRSFDLQAELAREGRVSPQQFGMSVHNATGGLFMMAQKARAPLTALAAGEEGALAGLQEACAELADGADAVWLLYCEEPLPGEYRQLLGDAAVRGDCHFAFLLELVSGSEFRLAPEAGGGEGRPALPLDLLRFLLRVEDARLCLSPRGNWTLRRTAIAGA
ncbi:MAG: beta-ketoacyl synthase chain length factor [Azoarcus sp.]|jgi:hypothetical protein|nr:beta-ketoacyl synthase chain length factor [Azoarcus sp.]